MPERETACMRRPVLDVGSPRCTLAAKHLAGAGRHCTVGNSTRSPCGCDATWINGGGSPSFEDCCEVRACVDT